jgi:hypothetical protein
MKEVSDNIANQSGPCGIICSTCPLGSGAVAQSANLTKRSIMDCKIPEWSPYFEDGKEIDWAMVEKGLNWMTKYAVCAVCENAGGPPDCAIRIGANERGYDLCSSCSDLESCTKFERLEDHGSQMKIALSKFKGRSKEEYIKAMASKMPWNSK